MEHPLDGYSEDWLKRKLASFEVEITHQGQLLTWRETKGQSKCPTTIGRGQVEEFSRAARLRMLKYIAVVDWQKMGRGIFLTLTYPDEVDTTSGKVLNKHRYLIHRHIEKELGRKVPVLWKVEWKPRLTGKKIDYLYPHWHLLIFDNSYLEHEKIKMLWKSVIHSEQTPIVHIVRADSEVGTAKYVAKYASKHDYYLDNAAYLNKPAIGRQWGILRKELIPLCKKYQVKLKDTEVLQKFRKSLVYEILQYQRENNTGFSVFGVNAALAAMYIFGIPMDDMN